MTTKKTFSVKAVYVLTLRLYIVYLSLTLFDHTMQSKRTWHNRKFPVYGLNLTRVCSIERRLKSKGQSD